MENISFIQDLAVVMIIAGFVTLLFRRLKQPIVLGYILAGIIISPHTPPFSLVTNERTIHTLAEVGVVFLMFGLGLEFNLNKLRTVGKTALNASIIEIIAMSAIGFVFGKLFGWCTTDCLFLGAMLAISSTTIIVKALKEQGLTGQKFSQMIFGILIVEDILGIAVMALLSAIALTDNFSMMEFADTIGRLVLYLAITLGAGYLIIRPVFRYVTSFGSNEGTLIVALGFCFASAFLAMKLGYSSALGAFIMGALIAEIHDIKKIDPLMAPLSDMFGAIFFVAVGMMIDPAIVTQYWIPISILTIVIIIGKAITCTIGTRVSGNDWNTSIKVGLGLTQIGEFSFIIATMGQSLGVTSAFLYPIAVSVSAITTFTTPYLIHHSDRIAGWFSKD